MTETPDRWKGYMGMRADTLLRVPGRSKEDAVAVEVNPDGETDGRGLVVEWEYPDAVFVLKRREVGGVDCYRVVEVLEFDDGKEAGDDDGDLPPGTAAES